MTGGDTISIVLDVIQVSKFVAREECIPVGCVQTAAVPTIRCQFWGSSVGRPPERQIPLKGRQLFGGRPPSSVNRQALLKTLPSLAVGNKREMKEKYTLAEEVQFFCVVTHLCLFTFDEPEGPEQVDAGNLDFQQPQSHRNTAPGSSSERKPVVRPVLQLLLRRESVRVKLLGLWPYLRVVVYGIDGYADDRTLGYVYVLDPCVVCALSFSSTKGIFLN